METTDSASVVPVLNDTRSTVRLPNSNYVAELFSENVYAVGQPRWRWRLSGPAGLNVGSWTSYDNQMQANLAVKQLLSKVPQAQIIEQGQPRQGLHFLVYPDPLSDGWLWNLVDETQTLVSSEEPQQSSLSVICYLEELREKLAGAELRLPS